MKAIDFNSMLPEENSEQFYKLKGETPYSLLLGYANALNKKYKPKLKCVVTESSKLSSSDALEENLVIALYFEAAIAKGYLYRLLEVQQLNGGIFPVEVKVFENHSSSLGKFDDYDKFALASIKFLESGFVKTLILNLLAQVDLYNESRNEKFQWGEKV